MPSPYGPRRRPKVVRYRTFGIKCSMSRTGDCYDNGVAERCFWSLKQEWIKHEKFADLEAARLSVFKYIETFLQFHAAASSARLSNSQRVETE
jgi:transposase InsO family protein